MLGEGLRSLVHVEVFGQVGADGSAAVVAGGPARSIDVLQQVRALVVAAQVHTLTMVTYYATFTEIVDNEKDRRFLSNTKSIADITYFIFGFALVPMILKGLNVKYVALICLNL